MHKPTRTSNQDLSSAICPTWDDLPPLPPVSDTTETVLDPEKKDKIVAELRKKGQQMAACATQRRADALQEWGQVLSILHEIQSNIVTLHEIRAAVLDSLSAEATDIARTEWCVSKGRAHKLHGSGQLMSLDLTHLTEVTIVDEEAHDLNKEYM